MAVEAAVKIVENVSFNHFSPRFHLLSLKKRSQRGRCDGVVTEGDGYLLLLGAHGYAHHFGASTFAGLPLLRQISSVLVLKVLLAFFLLHP